MARRTAARRPLPALPPASAAARAIAPDADAFRYRDERLTYADWDALADRLAAALAARGVGAATSSRSSCPSTPLYPVAYLAAARLGAVTTGINVRYRRTEIGHMLRRSGAASSSRSTRWHDADFRAMVEALRPELPELRDVVWLEPERSARARAPSSTSSPGLPRARRRRQPDDPVAIVFTSGTTGAPKAPGTRTANLLALAEIEARRHRRWRAALPAKHLAAGLSFAHVGFMARIAHPDRHRGCVDHPRHVRSGRRARDDRARAPRAPRRLSDAGDHAARPSRPRHAAISRRSNRAARRRALVAGADPPRAGHARRHRQRALLVDRGRHRHRLAPRRSARDPLDDGRQADARRRAAHRRRREPPGSDRRSRQGRSCARPRPCAATGATPRRRRPTIDAEGWIHTGDLGWLDDAGYLHLRGRESEMFIRGGFNVYPGRGRGRARAPPEGRARRRDRRAATTSRRDGLGVRRAARRRRDPPTLAELRAFVGDELASFKRPDGLTLLPELPVDADVQGRQAGAARSSPR